MGGEPRISHPECTEHQTTIRNGEKTVGPLTGVGMWQGPSRSAASFFVPNRGSLADHPLTRKNTIASEHHFRGGIRINSASRQVFHKPRWPIASRNVSSASAEVAIARLMKIPRARAALLGL
jgi:hypothetical protein